MLSSLGLLGCALLPAAGPADLDVRAGREYAGSLPYAFVPVSQKSLHVLAGAAPRLTPFVKDRRRPSELRFGVGDTVIITIFEAASGGLFIPSEAGVRPGNFIALPIQAVDNNGNVSVPYAGNIRARGRTRTELQDAIVEALENRAIEPQVVVSLSNQQTSLINVLGDVEAFRSPSSRPRRASEFLIRLPEPAGPVVPGLING